MLTGIELRKLPKIKMERKAVYSIEEVLSKVTTPITQITHHPMRDSIRVIHPKVDFDGDLMKMTSLRYHTFLKSGTKCTCCGLETKYFVKEKFPKDKPFHFNLYGLSEDNEEVLFTKHCVDQDKKEYVTMCFDCNMRIAKEKGLLNN